MRYFRRKLDDKNRLTIPAEVRDEFGGGEVVIAPGFGKYLHLYPAKVWEGDLQTALEGKWLGPEAKPAVINQELADLADSLLDGMVETMLDSKQGRITIDQELLDYAGIATGGEVTATRMPGGYWRLKRPTR